MKNWIKIFLLISLSLSSSYAFANYYKYKDKNGKTVIDSILPPEVANDGYEIISPRGNVIETVSPRKSQEQLAIEAKEETQRQESEKQAEISRRNAEIQAHKDDILLKSFSDESDLVRSRDEKIASIKVVEGITRENIHSLEKQLNDAKNSAAIHLKANQPIPASLQKNIDESQRQINENNHFLERKAEEIKAIQTKYEGWILRFRELQKEHPQPADPQIHSQ